MKPKNKITQTLLSAWLFSYKTDNGYDEFLKTLNRVKTPPTKKMLDGIRFENCVNSVLNGQYIEKTHEWYKPIISIKDELWGAQQQVLLFKDIVVDGREIVLQGVLDYLKAGVIYDTK